MSRHPRIIIAIALVIILGLLAWWFFVHENTAPIGTQTASSTPGNLFPYGQNNPSENTGGVGTLPTSTTTTIVETNIPQTLIHITTTPVSGMIFLPGTSTSSPLTLRYMDRATGHIYDYVFGTGTSTEVTNTTIPKVYNAYFSPNALHVVTQTVDDADTINTMTTYVSTTTGTLTNMVTLPKNILGLSFSPANELFFLAPVNGGSAGYTANADGSKPVEIFTSALTELTPTWSGSDISLLTHPSASVGGYDLSLDPRTGSVGSVMRNVAGLTALPSMTGNFIFTSDAAEGGIESSIYNTKSDANQNLTIATPADKCVWGTKNVDEVYCAVPALASSGTLPDDWYQGNIFLDENNIWKINADTDETNIVDFLSSGHGNIDAIKLTLDQNETWLAFINKEDYTLWALKIGQ